jgi:hypothetical protein
MRKYLILIIIVLNYCSLVTNNNSNIKVDNRLVVFEENCNDCQLDSSSIGNFKYIILKLSDESIFGEISKVIYKEGRFFILDTRYAKALLVFDKLGNFLFKIHKIGKGPGEYIKLKDFDVDDDGNIYLLDVNLRKINKYDRNGLYLNSTINKFFSMSFVLLNNKNDFMFYRANVREKKNLNFNLVQWNEKNLSVYFPYRSIYDDDKFGTATDYPLIKSEKTILYTHGFSDTIYEIKSNEIYAKYYFNFGKTKLPYNYLSKIREEKRLEYLVTNKKYAWGLENCYETNNYFSSTFLLDGGLCYFYYSKRTHKYKYMKVSNFKNQKVLGSLMPIGVYDDDTFIGQLDQVSISKFKGAVGLKMSKTNTDLLYTLRLTQREVNPILILYQLNKF